MISQTQVYTLSMPTPMKDNLCEQPSLPNWETDPANPRTWSMPTMLYNTAVVLVLSPHTSVHPPHATSSWNTRSNS
ncbi:hypothetical protein BDW71DRAFT_82738 [Aspergillus fruticulosus]